LDALLIIAGMEEQTKKWDQVDKDMLALTVQNLSLEEVKSRYPALPADGIKRLKRHLDYLARNPK
jgi:hypothetical protein